MTAPGAGVPDGAQTPASVSGLQGMTEASIMSGLRGPIDGQAQGARGIFWSVIGLVRGIVQTVVGGIAAVLNTIGSLFSLGRQDTAAVDQKRVEGELAIVANMSSNLEYLDELQRVGGSYADWPRWQISYGELNPHPLPLTDAFPLAQGAVWHPPVRAWDPAWDETTTWVGNDASRGTLATLSGTLELLEPGLWMIYFQAAVLQGGGYTNTPSDVWCYVTDQSEYVPVGSPVSGMDSYYRLDGSKSTSDVHGFGAIHTFGRAGQYLGSRDSTQGGGNTVSGYMMCYLDSPGWFVHMSCSAYQHFGGPASTFVFAQKVNSSTLRGDIDQAKADLEAALPGTPITQQLDETAIAAMIADAESIEVPQVESTP
ncbi:hypothetical protein R3P82_12585 [Dietzia maris]|uniref:Uncharacterized protein n=1 Tax=Dietzia maris TaxID=37915 RepID=A0AAE4R2S6_9ACTN|nr:hypothetical protein [Dietzia maris]MDV6299946.1 hypothetical protein [Dietzia maris]